MTDNPINVAGIEIPSDSPVFLAVLGAHVLFGLASVVSGVGAMLSQKRPGRHPRFGTIYYYCLSVVFASATILSAMRWAEDYHLFILGSLSFGTASLGRMVIRRRLMCTLGALAALSSNSAAIAISRDSCFSLDSGPGSRLYNPL